MKEGYGGEERKKKKNENTIWAFCKTRRTKEKKRIKKTIGNEMKNKKKTARMLKEGRATEEGGKSVP